MANTFIFYTNLISSFLIAVIGITGNLAILYFFLIKCWKRINSYYLFIIYLAFSDLTVCITRFVLITALYFAPETRTATLLCENTWFLGIGISNTSIWILCGLSFDRYRKITKPLARQQPKWLIHITCITPAFIGYWIYYPYNQTLKWDHANKDCSEAIEMSYGISITLFALHTILVCILPISTNIYANYRIGRYLNSNNDNIQIQQSEIHERNKRASSTLKSLTIIASITVFIPNVFITALYATYFMTNSFEIIPKELYIILSNVMFFNSIINVFVYWFHIKEFCSFYAKKIHSCFRS